MGTKDSDKALNDIRKKIDDIDEKIVSLLAERQDIVKEIIDLKKANNIPVYHPAREEDLISRRRLQSADNGLDPDYIEEVYRTILRSSRKEQSTEIAVKGIRPGATILIVGGKRGMGRYFHEWFEKAGYKVKILGREEWPEAEQLCKGIDLAMISVPIDVTCEIAEKLGPCLPPDAVLCDVTSIKEEPVNAMLAAHSGPVLGLHPLFGPSTSTLDKQIVVATSGRDDSACQWVIDQFSAWGSIIVRSDPNEHDEVMAIVQSLRHFATFSFGQFLKRRKANLARSLEFSSPIYRLELGMVGRLFAQDPSLYSEIIFASKERLDLLKDYIASMNENLEMLEKGDKTFFNEEFEKISKWFGPFGEQAMRESSYLIDKLIERF